MSYDAPDNRTRATGELPPDTMGVDPNDESLFAQRSGIRDPLRRVGSITNSRWEMPETEAPQQKTLPQPKPGQKKMPGKGGDHQKKEPPKKDPARRKGPPKLARAHDIEEAQHQASRNDYLRSRRKKKKLRVFYQRVGLLFKLAFAIVLAGLVWLVIKSPFWTLEAPQFELSGQYLIQPPLIRPFITPLVGKPLYQIDTGKLAERIKQRYGVLANVAVRRKLFPARLSVILDEKIPWAVLCASPESAQPFALAAGSKMLSTRNYPYQTGVYKGRTVDKLFFRPGSVYKISYLNSLHELAWQARQIHGLHFVSLDARDSQMVRLNFEETSVILGQLNARAADRLSRLIPLIPKLKEWGPAVEAVDLHWEEQVTLHTKPGVALKTDQNAAKVDG